MSTLPEVVSESPTLVVAHVGDICIAVPRGPATPSGVASIRRGLTNLATQRRGGIGFLFVVAASVGPPSGEARDAAAEMFRALRGDLKVVSAYMAGSGFFAAAKRSVFTWATSTLLGRTPMKAFGRIVEATDWLESSARAASLDAPSADAMRVFVHGVAPNVQD